MRSRKSKRLLERLIVSTKLRFNSTPARRILNSRLKLQSLVNLIQKYNPTCLALMLYFCLHKCIYSTKKSRVNRGLACWSRRCRPNRYPNQNSFTVASRTLISSSLLCAHKLLLEYGFRTQKDKFVGWKLGISHCNHLCNYWPITNTYIQCLVRNV